jgi:hypothetical protein
MRPERSPAALAQAQRILDAAARRLLAQQAATGKKDEAPAAAA